MDLLALNQDTFQPNPNGLVESWSSLIWTERYATPGEFTLKSSNIRQTLSELPEGSLVSLLDSREVMMVETHTIKKSQTGAPELEVKGRSLTSFLENRYLEGPYQKKFRSPYKWSYVEVISALIWNAIINSSDQDATKASTAWFHSTKDAIPGVLMTVDAPTIPEQQAVKLLNQAYRWLQPGEVSKEVERLLQASSYGLRTLRPRGGEDVFSLSFNITPVAKGLPIYSWIQSSESLQFQLYFERDRTAEKPNAIVLRDDAGALTETEYLKSIKDWKTTARVISGSGPIGVNRSAELGANTGLKRRVMVVDGGSKEDSENAAEFTDSLKTTGKGALAKKTKVNLMTTNFADRTGLSYIRGDYRLGDKITIIGDYGFSDDYRIVEYVRSQDSNGEVGYPGISSPERQDDT